MRKIPQEWLTSAVILLPKCNDVKKSSDFRSTSLISHVLKLFSKIIHYRIYKECEDHMGPQNLVLGLAWEVKRPLLVSLCS